MTTNAKLAIEAHVRGHGLKDHERRVDSWHGWYQWSSTGPAA